MNTKQIKAAISQLDTEEVSDIMLWCERLVEQRDYVRRSDDSTGIDPRHVLRQFRRLLPGRGPSLDGLTLDHGGTAILTFYEDTRVCGCRFEADADMLLAEWGPLPDGYSLSFTRQIIPARTDGEQVPRQLRLAFTFGQPLPARLPAEGSRWFRSLRACDAFRRFLYTSRVATRLNPLKPQRIALTYTSVE